MEVRDDDEAGTYRLMYTTKIGANVFVLDFFQKKSKSGTATRSMHSTESAYDSRKHVTYMRKKNPPGADNVTRSGAAETSSPTLVSRMQTSCL